MGYDFRKGLVALLSLGVSHEVAVRYWRGLQPPEGSTGQCGQDGPCIWLVVDAGSSAGLWRELFPAGLSQGRQTIYVAATFGQSKRPKRKKQKCHGLFRSSQRSHTATFLLYFIGKAVTSPSWFRGGDSIPAFDGRMLTNVGVKF